MRNYSNSKIYKITNSINSSIYIGSTTSDLKKRMDYHILSSKTNETMKLYQLFKELGSDKFKIELVENYPCVKNQDLDRKSVV